MTLLLLYIIIKLFYDVLKMFCFVFVWYPCMAINVSVQHNGGLLPGIILFVDPMLLPSGNPFKCHEVVLYLFAAYDPT